MRTILPILLILFFLSPWTCRSIGNPDDLFEASLQQIRKKDFQQAEWSVKQAIALDSTRSDFRILLANLYAWRQQNDSATILLRQVYQLEPTNQELYETWLNVLLWKKDYRELLKVGELADRNGYRNRYNWLLKRTEAYINLEEYNLAWELLNKPEHATFLDSSKLNVLRQDLVLLHQHRSITVSYGADIASSPSSSLHHAASIDVAQRFHRTNVLLRANYAYRFNQGGLQLESDVYQRFANKSYLYLNAGTALGTKIFPTFRAGAEYTLSFLKTHEASLGFRYLNYPNLPVYLLTGQVAKYLHSWWVGVRPFYTLKNNGNALTTLLDIRKYERISRNFSELELGYGNSPDERLFLENGGKYFGLDAWKIKLSSNRLIHGKDEIRVSATYSKEEYSYNTYRDRFMVELLYKFSLP